MILMMMVVMKTMIIILAIYNTGDDSDGGDGVVGCKEWSEEDGRTRLRPFADPPLAINLTG